MGRFLCGTDEQQGDAGVVNRWFTILHLSRVISHIQFSAVLFYNRYIRSVREYDLKNKEEKSMKRFQKAMGAALAASLILTGCGNTSGEGTPASASKEPDKETSSQAAADTGSQETPGEESKPETEKELEGTLVYWSMWNDTEPQGEVWQEVIDGFMTEHPKVKIEVQWCGRDIKKILKPALDGGQTIDVFEYPLEAEVGDYVMDLTDYVQQTFDTTDGKALADTILPSMTVTPKSQTGRTDMLPAVGYKPYMSLFMYNTAIFKEAGVTSEPKTWEELDAACAKIKEAGYVPLTFDDAYAAWLPGMFLGREKGQEWVQQLVKDPTGEMWKDEAVIHMAESFADFAQKGYFDENVGGNKYPAGQVDIGSGKVAMYYNLTGLPTEVADITGPDFEWGGFSFPDVVDGANRCGKEDVSGCTMLSINKNTADSDLAMEFIAYFLSKDQEMVDKAGTIPASLKATWPKNMQGMKNAFENVETVIKVASDITSNPDLTPTISENFIKLAAGQITAQQFVDNMAAAAKQ